MTLKKIELQIGKNDTMVEQQETSVIVASVFLGIIVILAIVMCVKAPKSDACCVPQNLHASSHAMRRQHGSLPLDGGSTRSLERQTKALRYYTDSHGPGRCEGGNNYSARARKNRVARTGYCDNSNGAHAELMRQRRKNLLETGVKSKCRALGGRGYRSRLEHRDHCSGETDEARRMREYNFYARRA